jgi:hypothetical protein
LRRDFEVLRLGAIIALFLPCVGRVAIGATTRAKTAAVLPTHRLHRERQRDHLLKKAAEVELTPAEPAGLELVAQEYSVAGERRGALRIGGNPTARRLEHQPEAFANRLTIASEAPPARQLEQALDLPLQVEIFAHAVEAGPDFQDPPEPLCKLRIAAAALPPPRGSHAEEELGGALGQSVDQDFHAAGPPHRVSETAEKTPGCLDRRIAEGDAERQPGRAIPGGFGILGGDG